jgi:CTP:molybdopterin cytidylyltransferase MocA
MKPTLLVLAAGMGSRYGGLKQIDPMGPSGETILDYSVFDAIRAGFGKVVFIIRPDFGGERVITQTNELGLQVGERIIVTETDMARISRAPDGTAATRR